MGVIADTLLGKRIVRVEETDDAIEIETDNRELISLALDEERPSRITKVPTSEELRRSLLDD